MTISRRVRLKVVPPSLVDENEHAQRIRAFLRNLTRLDGEPILETRFTKTRGGGQREQSYLSVTVSPAVGPGVHSLILWAEDLFAITLEE